MLWSYSSTLLVVSVVQWVGLYHCMILCVPSLLMRLIIRSLMKSNCKWNECYQWDRRTHMDRTVVIPCPDLLYSTVPVDLSDPSLMLIFRAPQCTYGSLGVYDSSARCVDVANHSNKSLVAVVVGPRVKCSDDEICNRFKEAVQVLRMPTSKGLLLHRLLVPRPQDYESVRELQQRKVTCTVHRSSSILQFRDRRTSAADFVQHFSVTISCSLLSICAIIPFGLSNPPNISLKLLLQSTVLAALSAAFCTVCTVYLLKNPSIVVRTRILELSQVGLWNFNVLSSGPGYASPDRSGSLVDAFVHLIFFLHGALGLIPSEVQYGSTVNAYSSGFETNGGFDVRDLISERDAVVPLQYGKSYEIIVPKLDLDCEWWSITLYGHDLFLLPNEMNLYSVNSFQLQDALRSVSVDNDTEPIRVVCSPVEPNRDNGNLPRAMFWLPLPDMRQANDSPKKWCKASFMSPRLVLRVYRPKGTKWLSRAMQKKILPTVKEVA